jgi:hypothetical protein
MKQSAWDGFKKARDRYRREISRMARRLPELGPLQQKFVDNRSPSYNVETPVVYNRALDDVSADSEIRMILVADNPGRREQAAENRRYLVGPSGKIADKFFRDNPALHIDFRKNVIILNKTPIHTPRTADLKELCRLGGPALEKELEESQRFMARLLLDFQKALAVPVWITGYSEMKKGGLFESYTDELKNIYNGTGLEDAVFIYRHFSMNQFTIDLNRQTAPKETLTQTLEKIGAAYRRKFLW